MCDPPVSAQTCVQSSSAKRFGVALVKRERRFLRRKVRKEKRVEEKKRRREGEKGKEEGRTKKGRE
jgi:hypothetical protein